MNYVNNKNTTMNKCLTCDKELHKNNDNQILKFCNKACRKDRKVDTNPFVGITSLAKKLLLKNYRNVNWWITGRI